MKGDVMALFGLFSGKKDLFSDLYKIEGLLAKGNKTKAYRRMESLRKNLDTESLGKTQELYLKIQDSFREEYLLKAKTVEDKGLFADAAEWVGMAADFCPDKQQRETLLDRQDTLLDKDEALEQVVEEDVDVPVCRVQEENISISVNEEEHLEALFNMFKPEIASYYHDLPQKHREAVAALYRGESDSFLTQADELLKTFEDAYALPEASCDAVILLERARTLMAQGHYEEARVDLDKIWDFFGTDSLDLAGNTSIPFLWSDCSLQLNEPDKVLDRCHAMISVKNGNPNLILLIGIALGDTGHPEEAVDLLLEMSKRNDMPEFIYYAARILNAEGEWKNAISVLEKKVTPSCVTGQCYAPPMHLPSLHLLVSIYVEHKVGLERAHELLVEGGRRLRGYPSKEHLTLWAHYFEATGEEKLAKQAYEDAEAAMEGQPQEDAPQIDMGDSAVL